MRARFVCGITVWDGDSASRDSDNAPYAAPDAADYNRLIKEVAASQAQINVDTAAVVAAQADATTGIADAATAQAAAVAAQADATTGIADAATAQAAVDAVELITGGADPIALHAAGTPEVVTGMTVVERGDGAIHKTIITLLNVAVAIADGTTPATDAAWGTLLLYTLPEGHAIIFGGHEVYLTGDISATGAGALTATADLEIGVGTTARANASNFALQTAEDNLVPGQVGVDLVGSASDADESNQLAAALFFDGSTTAAAVNLNVVTLDDADAAPGVDTLTVSGTITLIWTMQGDN